MVPNWGKTLVKNEENEKADKIAIINNIDKWYLVSYVNNSRSYL